MSPLMKWVDNTIASQLQPKAYQGGEMVLLVNRPAQEGVGSTDVKGRNNLR